MALDTLPLLEKGGEVVLVIDMFPLVESKYADKRHLIIIQTASNSRQDRINFGFVF